MNLRARLKGESKVAYASKGVGKRSSVLNTIGQSLRIGRTRHAYLLTEGSREVAPGGDRLYRYSASSATERWPRQRAPLAITRVLPNDASRWWGGSVIYGVRNG